jgi:hypothetical protein
MPPRRSGLAWIRPAARQSSMARAAPITTMSPLICRRLTLVSSLAQSHGAPCINVLLGISAEASVMVGEFGIEAAFIVAPGMLAVRYLRDSI